MRTDVVLTSVLSEREQEIYKAIQLVTQTELQSQLAEGKFSFISALEALLRLRQASCHIGLLPQQEAETSSKVELLMDKVSEVITAGHKVLVFSQWTQFLDKIEPHFKSLDIDFVRLDGSTRNRKEIVERFQSADGPPIFLSSLKAGGTGLNLTAADHVFLMDPWWNPAVEEQAADRAHRIGQEKPVFVHRIVSKDTVEERILLLQEKKKNLANSVLEETGSISAITKEDLLELLQDDFERL